MRIKELLLTSLLTVYSLVSFAYDHYSATKDLNVRSGPGTNYTVIFSLQKGDEVEVLSKNSSWYKIKYLDKTGYAYSRFLEVVPDTTVNDSAQFDTSETSSNRLKPWIIVLWLFPILLILASRKTTRREKIRWLLAVLFISWFAWVAYRRAATESEPSDNILTESNEATTGRDKPTVDEKPRLSYLQWLFMSSRQRRRYYYRNEYLKSEAWQRKRYVVLKRDNWRCVYCGSRATQVHHKRYAKRNIGREPIEWLVSICRSCHEGIHRT